MAAVCITSGKDFATKQDMATWQSAVGEMPSATPAATCTSHAIRIYQLPTVIAIYFWESMIKVINAISLGNPVQLQADLKEHLFIVSTSLEMVLPGFSNHHITTSPI